MLISKAEFARSQGFSKPYVTQLIKAGHLIPVEGKIDTDQAEAVLAAIHQPGHAPSRSNFSQQLTESAKTASTTAELSKTLLRTRIKNEVERGKLLEVEAKAKTGQYIEVEAVEKEAFQLARTVRDALQNIPDRVASLLASLSDSNAIYDILSQEIRTALESLEEA